MIVNLQDVAKRYNYEWIFRHVNYAFFDGNAYAILGSNGSGKSTLLQIISGNYLVSEGSVDYRYQSKKIDSENIYQYLSFSSPYIDFFEEFTLLESIDFHSQFKKFYNGLNSDEIVVLIDLEKHKNKPIKYFSSGMKQRLRLGLAILSDTPLLLLDEPSNNLDKKGIDWYQKLLQEYRHKRLIVICSNQQTHEYFICNKELNIEDFKPA